MAAAAKSGSRSELRKKPRRAFHYSARILTDEHAPPVACSIADISQSGARVVLEHDQALPDHFLLLLTETGGARRNCRVIWRTGPNIGVEFPQD